MKKTLLISMLLLAFALLMTSAAAETITYTGTEAMTVGATFTVKHSCGNPNAVCTVTTAATCTTAGVGSCFCDECGPAYANWTVSIAANEKFHVWKTETQGATCATEGRSGRRCTICQEWHKTATVLPRRGEHDWSDWAQTNPTCTEDGYKVRYCKNRCGETQSEQIPTPGHPGTKYMVGQNATCEENGVGINMCVRCGEAVSTVTLPATGHKYGEWITTQNPTCVKGGLQTSTCSNCGHTEGKMIAASGHSWTAWEPDPDYHRATCKLQGRERRTCTVCGETEYQLTPNLDHDWSEWATYTEATCTTPGKNFRTCQRCGEEAYEEIWTLKPHDDSEGTPLRKPNCVSDGYTIGKCKVCGEITWESYPKADPDAHTWGEWETIVETTCTEGGEKRHTCQVCGTQEFCWPSPLDHTWGDKSYWISEPHCTDFCERMLVCDVCGFEQPSLDLTRIPHEIYKVVRVQNPTCSTTGMDDHICRLCNDSPYYEIVPIDPDAHVWGKWQAIDGATCEAGGMVTRVCTLCNAAETKRLYPFSHAFGKGSYWARESTCYAPGELVHVCDLCGYEKPTLDLTPVPHTLGEYVPTKNPTCSTEGEESEFCTVCGERQFYKIIPIDPEAHVWGEPYDDTGASCSEVGTWKVKCELCGKIETHEYKLDCLTFHEDKKDPTCTERGWIVWRCDRCNTEHSPYEYIDALGHDLVTVPAVPATESFAGLTSGLQCSRCGYWAREQHPLRVNYSVKAVTLSMEPNDRGSVFDSEGTYLEYNHNLLDWFSIVTYENETSPAYITVYYNEKGNICGYVDSNGGLYYGAGYDYNLYGNIADEDIQEELNHPEFDAWID